MKHVINEFKLDSYYFGVMYKENLRAIDFIQKINNDLDNMFEVKVYYSKENGYDKSLEHLASKLKKHKNERYKFIAFLYSTDYDIHIPVVQHSQAKYLTFEFYGLEQYKEKSKYKKQMLKETLTKLFNNKYILKTIKMDWCYDFKDMPFEEVAEIVDEHFKNKKRYPYIYKENETIYFNSKTVNECIKKQKCTNENLSCSSKNKYINIILYNKAKKHNLNYDLVRLEFVYKSMFFNNFEYKFITSMEDFYYGLELVKIKS